MLSLNSLEALPFINKLQLKSKEKSIVGIAVVVTTAVILAFLISALLFKSTMPKEPEVTLPEYDTSTTPEVVYDSLSLEGFKNSATLHFQQGNFYEAGLYLEKLIKQDERDTFALKMMITVLTNLEKRAEAKLFLEKLNSLEPNNCQNKKLEIALLSSEEVLSNHQKERYKECLKEPGISNAIANKILGKAPELSKSLLKGANKADGLSLIKIKEQLKDSIFHSDEIEELLVSANKTNPLNYEGHLLLGQILLKEKRVEEAEKALLIAQRLSPENHLIRYHLGILNFRYKENPEKGALFFEKALELEPSHWESALQMGLIFQKKGKPAGAIHYFNKSLNYAPHNIRILLQLAAAYETNSQKKSAIETYNKILELDNRNDIALYKIKILKKD